VWAMVLVIWDCGPSWFNARGVDRGTGHARYPSETHALHWQEVTIM